MKKVGFIGLDTSHVVELAQLLNDPKDEHHIAGFQVAVAWPGGSPDFDLSWSRVAGFTATLRDQYGVRIVDSPEAVAEACDLLFIESADGRVHLEQFKRTLSFRKPTFIDKPFATTLADAREMVRLSREAGIPLMSCSSLRFADELQATLARGRDDIAGCDVYGPMAEQPTQPGLFWYGCHSVEMMVTTMGVGCREVRCLRTDGQDLLTAVWKDGRIASLHGLRGSHSKFGMLLHRKQKVEHINTDNGRPGFACLLSAIFNSLPNHRSAVPADEMIEIVAIIEAANQSRDHGGKAVAV